MPVEALANSGRALIGQTSRGGELTSWVVRIVRWQIVKANAFSFLLLDSDGFV